MLCHSLNLEADIRRVVPIICLCTDNFWAQKWQLAVCISFNLCYVVLVPICIISSWASPTSIFASFWLFNHISTVKMAQEENDDLPDTPSVILPQLDHLPSKDQHSRASDRAIESVLHKCGDTSGYCQVNAAINPTQIEDEEVQFVFSVPRRKRKKRKRYSV